MLSEYQLKISDLYNITIDNVKMLVPNFFDKKVCDQGRRNRRGRRSGGPCPPPPNVFQQSESGLFQQSCKHFLFSLTQS